MFCFDPRDIFYILSLTKKDKALEISEQRLYKNISETQKEAALLKTNAQTIEKYAREKYLMKKDNEDLFIINSPSEPK
jgi:cell division protein DivIC